MTYNKGRDFMKLLNKTASAAHTVLMLLAAGAGVLMLAFGVYVLYDIRYTGQNAYISQDLLQYRPKQPADEGGAETFAELHEINPDVIGWLEMFDTHINYPVVQGCDDLEYLNKDIYGDPSVSGSIYLSADNSGDLSDPYNLIYGHHIESGAMFGDIKNFLDADYFSSHKEGLLQTETGTYLLKAVACVCTDAYDSLIYNTSKNAVSAFQTLRDYLAENAVQYSEFTADLHDETMVGLSTCTDAVTNGRIVLFVVAVPLNSEEAEHYMTLITDEVPADIIRRSPLGYFTDSDHWALLNLLCAAESLLILLPFTAVIRKYRQIPYSRKLLKKIRDDTEDNDKDNDTNDKEEGECEEHEDEKTICKHLRRFIRKMYIGTILESILLTVSAVLFLMTEDLSKKMTLYDKWTGLMILIAAAGLFADYFTFRYRGKLPEEETPQQRSYTEYIS